MQKAGGIVALIGGVSGLWVASILVLLNIMSGTYDDGMRAEITLTVWSTFVTLFSAIAIRAKSKWPGLLLVATAVLGPLTLLILFVLYGPVLGGATGSFFAVFMVAVLIGGVLVVIGRKRSLEEPRQESA